MEDWLKQIQGWLNKAGDTWHSAWNKAITVPMMSGNQYSPVYTGTADKKPMTYQSTPKQEAGQTMTMAAAPALAVSAGTVGIPATVGGLVGGAVVGSVGKKVGEGTAQMLGLNQNAQDMFGTIGKFTGMGVGAKYSSNTVNNLIDQYFFRIRPNSFTRGIGTESGLEDLIESGMVRGNPKGTGMTPKLFNKVRYKGRDSDFWEPLLKDNPEILNHYYNQNLTEKEWLVLKNALDNYKPHGTSKLLPRKPLVLENTTYPEYLKNGEGHYQLTWDQWHPELEGNPPAYFYNDGRNMFGGASYNYAKSNFGIRLNNASEYEPYIPEGHLHYSVKKPLYLDDPNIEVFYKGPFGIPVKFNKNNILKKSQGN